MVQTTSTVQGAGVVAPGAGRLSPVLALKARAVEAAAKKAEEEREKREAAEYQKAKRNVDRAFVSMNALVTRLTEEFGVCKTDITLEHTPLDLHGVTYHVPRPWVRVGDGAGSLRFCHRTDCTAGPGAAVILDADGYEPGEMFAVWTIEDLSALAMFFADTPKASPHLLTEEDLFARAINR